jgi:hypothetical protein
MSKLKCKICYLSFRTVGALRRHYEEHGGGSTRHCNNCGANYPYDAYHRC